MGKSHTLPQGTDKFLHGTILAAHLNLWDAVCTTSVYICVAHAHSPDHGNCCNCAGSTCELALPNRHP